MFNEKLKALRIQKGMSQESLAQQLHVVRQTISKWEKGLSVPDADMLQSLATLFKVSVSELLDEPVEEKNVKELAIQVALLNQQMAARRRWWRRALIGIVVAIPLMFVLYMALLITLRSYQEPKELTSADLTCTLDGEVYVYGVVYDEQYRIVMAGGDAWIANHVQTENYSDANVLIAQIEDYFYLRGGEVKVTEEAYKEEEP